MRCELVHAPLPLDSSYVEITSSRLGGEEVQKSHRARKVVLSAGNEYMYAVYDLGAAVPHPMCFSGGHFSMTSTRARVYNGIFREPRLIFHYCIKLNHLYLPERPSQL